MLYFICSSLFCASSCDNIFFSLSYLQGKASGNKPALWLRSKIQTQLYQLGSNIQKNAGIFLFVGLLILAIFTFSLKNATLETRVEKLWVQGKPICFFLTFFSMCEFLVAFPWFLLGLVFCCRSQIPKQFKGLVRYIWALITKTSILRHLQTFDSLLILFNGSTLNIDIVHS